MGHLQPIDDARVLDRLVPHLKPDDRVERQHMRPAQIVIRVRTNFEPRTSNFEFRLAPLIVVNNSGYGCAATMR
jgi:hypothetical protein